MTPRPAADGLFERVGDDAIRLVGGYSPTSGERHFPLQSTCPYSGADDVQRVLLAESGTLWGHTAVTVAPPGFRGTVPYGFGIVELDDGLRVVGRLTEADTERLQHGQRMHVVSDTVFVGDDGNEVITWAFAPSEAAS